MADMEQLFPEGGPVSKSELRRHLPGPLFNVQGFGAKGNGAADDTLAIQAAIDAAGQAGGGIVYLPAGAYRIQPQAPVAQGRFRANALVIAADNITLRGDGPALSKLVFRAFGGKDPTENYQLHAWFPGEARRLVWRGSAILITGGDTAARARHDIAIEHLEIDGGVRPANNGDRSNPADERSPGGWDISHKGIYFQEDKHHRRLVIRDVHAHDFRGEIIYGGGEYIDDLLIEGCDIHGTNGDCISVSAGQVVRDNHLHDAAHACVESPHLGKPARYLANRIERARNGINIQTAWDSPLPAQISGNVFYECSEYGVLLNLENGATFITDNVLVDCGYSQPNHASIMLSPGSKGLSRPMINGVTIRNNTILRQARAGGLGLFIGCEPGAKLRSVVVSENFIGSSGPALDLDLRFLAPIAYAFPKGGDVGGVFVSKNLFFRTQRHVENVLSNLPELGAPMPLMWDNQALEYDDPVNSAAIVDGKKPLRLQNEGPVSLQSASIGDDPVPQLSLTDYVQGQRLVLTNADAARGVYIPQSSEIYECRVGRHLRPGVYLTLMRDGAKLRETAFEDRRERHHAEVTEGTVLAADGFEEIYLSPLAKRRFTSFSGIGHGAQLRIVATNANAVLAHNRVMQMRGGNDYPMRENEVKLFLRTRDGVLREI